MRRMWAAGAAIVMCLALGSPALGQDEAEPAARWAAVTGTSSCGLGQAGVVQMDTPPYRWTNWILRCLEAATDPRVSGPSTVVLNVESWDGREGLNAVAWWDYSIQGPDGTWDGHGYGLYDDEGVLHQSVILTGSGAYEGLTYTIAGTVPAGSADSEFHGLIQPGSLPPGFPGMPFPEPTPSFSPAPSLATIGLPAEDGARIVAVEEPDARTRDLTIESPSVGTVNVRLLLPTGFEPGAEADWPVLYLLHGGGNSYLNWTLETDVEELTAELPLLVVMPEAGAVAAYADWWNGGQGGPPMWETFHTSELRELLERNWQAGDERVVAGYSMGGLGAMAYAARHPGLFKAAASFTGVLHPVALDPMTAGFDIPSGVWGNRTTQADLWEAHDPVLLAPALEGILLYVSYGNGEPGPLDAGDAEFDALEASLAEMNETFVARLEELGIPVTVDAYGPGTHSMPYVERGLHEATPMLLEALGV